MYEWYAFFLLSILPLTMLVQFFWSRRKLHECARQFDGPPALPIIGNALSFNCHHMKIFQRVRKILNRWPQPPRLWLGPRLILFFTNIKHVERIMSSTKLAHKSDLYYKTFSDYTGNGLIVSSGAKWKEDRKRIQPMFSLKYSFCKIEMIHRYVDVLVSNLENLVDGDLHDIYPIFHTCCFDINAEIVYGLQLDSQRGNNMDISHAIEKAYQLVYERMVKPWLLFSPIYHFSRNKVERDRVKKIMWDFGTKAVAASDERLKNLQHDNYHEQMPIVDQMNQSIVNDGMVTSRDDMIYQLMTLFTAAEDTMSITSSILVVCFGMYQEHQEMALKEIHDILGPEPRDVTEDELRDFKYMDMCIKEAVRLATIAPFIIRKCIEEMQIGEYTIVPGSEICIPIFDIHRDPEHWENPEHFHPDHFLEENVKKRNPYAYLAFSAGPRSCIGKHIALVALKTIMIRLLTKFKFSAPGKMPDLKFHADISVRLRDGYNVKIT
ncbi:PREDICTED: cytochrome P450 4C1-like, partial [Nicrophorus vespilloides]|uniref:Cytochrome P450 4C1-like n=1 Tax=Nicrophorus vespilloides TaxID=110193 RepID=A0ABM1MYC8_NICVS